MATEPAAKPLSSSTLPPVPVVENGETTAKKVEEARCQTLNNLLKDKLAFLNQKKPAKKQWKILTDELLSESEPAVMQKLTERLTQSPKDINLLLYEMLHSVVYFESELRLSNQTFIKMFDIIWKFAPSKELLAFTTISWFNHFPTTNATSELLLKLKGISGIQLARYLKLSPNLTTRFKVIPNFREFGLELRSKAENFWIHQRRYFLLHESNEGYSLVISLLIEGAMASDSSFRVQSAADALRVLIGHYSLDPVRVIDLILDFISHFAVDNYRFLFDLLKLSDYWPVVEADNGSLESLNLGGSAVIAELLVLKIKSFEENKMQLTDLTKQLFLPLFVKTGAVSFGALWPHIGPDAATMKKFQEHIDEKVRDEVFKASASALALSAPLIEEDEDGNPIKKPELTESEIQKEADAKRRLIQSFESNPTLLFLKGALSLGLYFPALYILNKYPWLVHADEEVPLLIIRVFNEMLKPLKCASVVQSEADLRLLKKDKSTTVVRVTGHRASVFLEPYEYSEFDVIKPLKQNHAKKRFAFFFREWNDGLPLIQNYDDLFLRANELLSFLGVKLGEDCSLVSFLAKAGVTDIESSVAGEDEHKLNKWFLFYKKFILPATVSLHSNPITTNHAYELLSKFPQDWRYNLYGDLMKNLSKNNNHIKLHYGKAEKATKDLMKRITTQNLSEMMKKLAKITYANPLPSLLTLIERLESYNNLIDLIVQSAAYFTDYAWDVLTYAVLLRLTVNRPARQEDGMNDMLWLQSLSSFIAKFARVYEQFNIDPILQFIVRSLHQGQSTVGLTLLRDLIIEMAGIQTDSNMSGMQIRLKNSGDSMVRIVNEVIKDTRDSSAVSGKRLICGLAKSNSLVEVLVLLNDTKERTINNTDQHSHYKVVANQVDEIDAIIHLYIEFVCHFMKNDKEKLFHDSVPALKELVEQYKLSSCLSFELLRFDDARDWEKQCESVDFFDVDFQSLSKSLFVNFWKFNVYDIFCDESLYNEQLEKIQSALRSNEEKLAGFMVRGQVELTNTVEKQKTTAQSIVTDKEKHVAHVQSIVQLVKENLAGNCFQDPVNPSDTEIESFFQFCVLPRALNSSSDAFYAFKFIATVFPLSTSAKLFHWFFEREILDTLLLSFTTSEADNFGMFFSGVYAYYESQRTQESATDDFKSEIFNWSESILGSLVSNIANENYMSRKNTFTFLKTFIASYPTIEDHGVKLLASITKMLKTETRSDIVLAANSANANIARHRNGWVMIWDYLTFTAEQKQELQKKREIRIAQEKRLERQKQQEDEIKADLAASKLRTSRPTTTTAAAVGNATAGTGTSAHSSRINTPPGSRGGNASDLFIPGAQKNKPASSSVTPAAPSSRSGSATPAKPVELPSGPKLTPTGLKLPTGPVTSSEKKESETHQKVVAKSEVNKPLSVPSPDTVSFQVKVETPLKSVVSAAESKSSTTSSTPTSISRDSASTTSSKPLPSGPKLSGRFKDVTSALANQPRSQSPPIATQPATATTTTTTTSTIGTKEKKISIKADGPLPDQRTLLNLPPSTQRGKYGHISNNGKRSGGMMGHNESGGAVSGAYNQGSSNQPRGHPSSSSTSTATSSTSSSMGSFPASGANSTRRGSFNKDTKPNLHGANNTPLGPSNHSIGSGSGNNNNSNNSQRLDPTTASNSFQGGNARGRSVPGAAGLGRGHGAPFVPPSPSGPPPENQKMDRKRSRESGYSGGYNPKRQNRR